MYIKVQMLKIIVVCSIEYIINLKIVLYLKIAALSIFNSTPRILVLGSETQYYNVRARFTPCVIWRGIFRIARL